MQVYITKIQTMSSTEAPPPNTILSQITIWVTINNMSLSTYLREKNKPGLIHELEASAEQDDFSDHSVLKSTK